jgi:nicotinate-nucleotide adenylyltransferase
VQPVRIGLFGGTFCPPHNGHVAALAAAWETGWFDQLLVTVVGDPYHKEGTDLLPAPVRLAMAHAAFDPLPGAVVTDSEIVRGGPTYTVDTVRELVADGHRVTVIVGADAAVNLDEWHDAAALVSLATIAIVPRTGCAPTVGARWRAVEIPMDPVDLSSTHIRRGTDSPEVLAASIPVAALSIFLDARG